MCLELEMAENMAHIGMAVPPRSSQTELISPNSVDQFLRKNGLLPEEGSSCPGVVMATPLIGKYTGPQYLD
jgi:hypothetical protein